MMKTNIMAYRQTEKFDALAAVQRRVTANSVDHRRVDQRLDVVNAHSSAIGTWLKNGRDELRYF